MKCSECGTELDSLGLYCPKCEPGHTMGDTSSAKPRPGAPSVKPTDLRYRVALLFAVIGFFAGIARACYFSIGLESMGETFMGTLVVFAVLGYVVGRVMEDRRRG